MGGSELQLRQVENFEGVNEKEINICFTTIQQLHLDMTADRENAPTLEDFADKRIVFLSDEAHHMNVRSESRAVGAGTGGSDDRVGRTRWSG